jgi:hypothetical protein
VLSQQRLLLLLRGKGRRPRTEPHLNSPGPWILEGRPHPAGGPCVGGAGAANAAGLAAA